MDIPAALLVRNLDYTLAKNLPYKQAIHEAAPAFLQELAHQLGLPPDAMTVETQPEALDALGFVRAQGVSLTLTVSKSPVGSGLVLEYRARQDGADTWGEGSLVSLTDLQSDERLQRFLRHCAALLEVFAPIRRAA